MEYYNFDLSIDRRVEGRYPVRARSETQGEADGALAFDPASREIQASLARLGTDVATPDREFLKRVGGLLWEGLFRGGVRDLYQRCLGQVRDDARGVRIRLCIDAPELSVLPWELLHDPVRDTFLATSSETPLTRYISLQEPLRAMQTRPPIGMLIAIPAGSGLDAQSERDALTRALAGLGDAVVPRFVEGRVTRSTIREALVSARFHVFHFIGHGAFQDGEGHLLLNSDGDPPEPDWMSGHSFGGFFQDYPSMRLIVLNACQGAQMSAAQPLAGVAPQLVRRGVPAVVAMQYPIDDRAAVLFAREFYRKLCTGYDRGRVDAAVSYARNSLESDYPGTSAFATPVLFMRSSAGGEIFDLDHPGDRPLILPEAEIHRLKEVKRTYAADTDLLKASGDPAAAAAIAANERRVAAIERQIRRRNVLLALVVSLPVLLASWLSLFNAPFFFRLDDRLEFEFVRAMDWLVPAGFSDRIVLVLADGDGSDNGPLGATSMAWRCHHADLIDGLSAAGATTVALDLFFDEGFAECDPKLAGAIERARARGTSVVVGVQHIDWIDRVARPRIAPALRSAVGDDGWGVLLAGAPDRKVSLAYPPTDPPPAFVEEIEAGVAPSFSLSIAMRLAAPGRGPLRASFDRRRRVIRLRDGNGAVAESIPVVDRYLSTIVGLPEASVLLEREKPYHEIVAGAREPDALAAFKDSVVVVGYKRSDDRRSIGRDRPLYGVHFQASVVSNLLEHEYVKPLPLGWHYLVIGAMAMAAALLRTRLRGLIPAPLLLVLAAYVAAAVFLYWLDRIALDISYHVFALAFTYWLLGKLRSGGRARDA